MGLTRTPSTARVEGIIREAATQAGSFVVKRRGAASDPNAKDEKIQF